MTAKHKVLGIVILTLTVSNAPARGVEPAQSSSPLDDLPPYITRLTQFGQRADWSHDGERILFLSKTFGDAYEVDLTTREIRPLTHHYFHEGYTRGQVSLDLP